MPKAKKRMISRQEAVVLLFLCLGHDEADLRTPSGSMLTMTQGNMEQEEVLLVITIASRNSIEAEELTRGKWRLRQTGRQRRQRQQPKFSQLEYGEPWMNLAYIPTFRFAPARCLSARVLPRLTKCRYIYLWSEKASVKWGQRTRWRKVEIRAKRES